MEKEYKKKITNKSELFQEDGSLIDLDLSNYDISALDLSDIDPNVWNGAIFYNTNFKNTGIKFYPRKLRKSYYFDIYSIENCNFENCDLSYLKDEDFKSVILKGVNLKNTNLQIDFHNNKVFNQAYNHIFAVSRQLDEERVNLTGGAILPSEYETKQVDYFDYVDLDIDFLKNNPNIKISSGKLLEVICNYFYGKYKLDDQVSEKEFNEYYHSFLEFLEYDTEGKLKRFYHDMEPYLTSPEKYLEFFQGKLKYVDFEELDLSYLDKKMLTSFLFYRCDIAKLKLGIPYKEIGKEIRRTLYVSFLEKTPVGELEIPMTIHDWQNRGYKRLSRSGITMRTDLYLEFDRICNMCCEFCRNEVLEKCPFAFEQIMKSLKLISNHLNNIVIGGGEPTIYLKELKKLSEIMRKLKTTHRINMKIITNGSLDYEEYNLLQMWYNYSFLFSRHAIDDEENRRIFGDKNKKILTTDELQQIEKKKKHTLCCTCFKGGVDTVDKIVEYVRYAKYLKYSNILFQNLHLEDECNKSINIPERIMMNAIEKLQGEGFLLKMPILSNSNYILYILKKEDITISFKIYKTRDVILNAWYKSPKRCFDLSMDPSGNLHESWKEENKPNILQRKNQL